MTGAARLGNRYQLIYSERLFEQTGFLAGSDAARLAELQQALADPSVEAVWCARGGYGLMRLLPALDLTAFARAPKLLIGFSDVTALHAWAALRALPTVHGPVITHLSDLPTSDIEALCAVESDGIKGVICGRSIYNGALDFTTAQRRADELNGAP